MSTIILQVDEYEELVRACEKAEARVEELEDLITSVTPNKDAEGIILNAKRRLGGEPGDSLIQLCIKAKYDCDRYFAALEWQPIETAPRDGTPILGWSIDYGQRETYLEKYGQGSIGYALWARGDGPLNIGWGWHEPVNNWGGTWAPTHWMPLPDPPKV